MNHKVIRDPITSYSVTPFLLNIKEQSVTC